MGGGTQTDLSQPVSCFEDISDGGCLPLPSHRQAPSKSPALHYKDTVPLEDDHHAHCLLSNTAPGQGLAPLLPGSLLSELSREAAENKSLPSGRVLGGIGAMLENSILGINEKQALQVTVIANQSTVDGSNLYVHCVS